MSKRSPFARNQCRPRLEMLEDRITPSAYVVNTLEDYDGQLGTLTSLRTAIDYANADQDTSVSIAFSLTGTIYLDSNYGALPALAAKTFTIDGTDITIDAGENSGIFYINSDATATISYFYLTNTDNDPAVVNDGELTLDGGSICQAMAGGVLNRGEQTITSETFWNNQSNTAGAAILNLPTGTMTIYNCNFSANQAGTGGAIANMGTMSITYSNLYENTAQTGGGAIINGNPVGVASLTIGSGVDIMNNSAANGGGIYNMANAVLYVGGSSSIYSNTATNYGGGIYNAGGGVTLSCMSLLANTATLRGGAMYTHSGTAELADVDVWGNEVTDQNNGFGGAIYSGQGTTTLQSGCAFADNICRTSGLNGNAIYQTANGTLNDNPNNNTFGENQTVVRE